MKLFQLAVILTALSFYAQGQNSLYVGRFIDGDLEGRIAASGPSAELSLSNRHAGSFVNIPTNGERWVLYNSGPITNGRLTFWTGSNKLSLTKSSDLYLGPLTDTVDFGGRLSLSGSNAELSLANPSVSEFVKNPTQGERWAIYNSGPANDGRLTFWSGSNKLSLTKAGDLYLGPTTGSTSNGGRLSLSGSSAELSFVNRSISTFVENPTGGERWTIYNSGSAYDGRLTFWSGSNKLSLTKTGDLYLGPAAGTTSSGGRLSLSGSSAELSFVNRSITTFVKNPTQGERWVIYNSGSPTDGRLNFWSGGDKVVFTKEGHVGIGTANPTALLTVNGKIEAEEIECKHIGADYVFDEDYKLKSLEDVAEFVEKNHHLPGIAPASETEKGVDLGVFTEKLLEKIEELTLYTIEQERKINALQAQLDAQ